MSDVTPRMMTNQLHGNLSVHHIQVIEPSTGKSRVFCLYDGISLDEVKSVYDTSFEEVKTTIGLRDENGIYYPLSLLAKCPQILTGHRLMIVSDEQRAATAAAQQRPAMIGIDSTDTLLTEEQVKRSFHLLDLNGDNFVHKEEFIDFMTTAYAKLLAYDDGLAFAYSCISAKDLAIVTAMQCYQYARIHQENSDGDAAAMSYYLDYDDFCAWYMSIGFDPLRELMIRSIEFYSTGMNDISRSTPNSTLRRSKSRSSLDLTKCNTGDEDLKNFVQHCRKSFFLGRRQYLDLIRVLSGVGKPSSIISKQKLKKIVLSHVQHVGNHSPLDHYTLHAIDILITTMIELSDENKDDSISVGHVISLLALCCEEHTLETFCAVFTAYKQVHPNQYDEAYEHPQGDGFASDLVLYNHLMITFRTLCYFSSDYVKVTGCHPDNLAHAIFLKFLLTIDVQRKQSDKLTLHEFVELYVHGLKMGLSLLQVRNGFFVELLQELIGGVGESSFALSKRLLAADSVDQELNAAYDIGQGNSSSEVASENLVGSTNASTSEDLLAMSPSADSLEDDQVVGNQVSYSGSMVTVSEARSVLGFFEYSSYDVIKFIVQLCDLTTGITAGAFNKGILRLIGEHYIELTVLQRSIADFILDRLSIVFDPEQSGTFSLNEMAIACLLFCEDDDSSYSRAEIVLALEKAKVWRFSAVVSVVTTLFKACYALNPVSPPSVVLEEAEADARAWTMESFMTDIGAQSLATSPAISNKQFLNLLNNVFTYLEQESERKKIESEIQSSYYVAESPTISDYRTKTVQGQSRESQDDSDAQSHSLRSFSEDGDSEGSIPYLNDELFPPSTAVLELRAASAVLGLENYNADDLIDKLGGESANGWLTSQAWAKWVSKVLQQSAVLEEEIDAAILLSNRIFAAFLSKGNTNQVEFARIAAGLAFFCTQSPLEERLMVSFTLLDDDSDGFLSFEQFCVLIQSVLLIISVSSKIVNGKILAIGATIDELTSAAAAEAFGALGLSPSDELTLEMLSDVSEDFLKLAALL